MKRNKHAVIIVFIVWALIVGLGWALLSHYENVPGQSQPLPEHWPLATKVRRTPGLPTLLMFVHPHCPCSRASAGELSLIMAHSQKKVRAQVLFLRPETLSEQWVKTDLWDSAMRIPGVEVVMDDQGKEARIFHANVSGQVMLYDARGNLVFSGGITPSRGHQGDNDGRDAIVSFLTKGIILHKQTPFFGCLLFSSLQQS
ncbi:MAG: hypothetical protein HY591_06225 [Candidatus Omnitrophica bacterium]|nr:hypothetical protein [Candidatus Omnitrophota bacterium]